MRPRPGWRDRPAILRQVRELSLQALLGAAPGDSALVRTDVPGEFLEHLDRAGLAVPRVLAHPESDPATTLSPFGWSAEAIELNRRHEAPAEHPESRTIAWVNSRSLAFEIESELGGEYAAGRIVGNLDELESYLAGATPGGEWVVKAEHGNSGLANRRLRGPGLTEADRRFVEAVLAEGDGLLVEPWRQRERDWCVVFEVPFDAGSLRIHETIGTRDGALIGALFEPGGPAETPWVERLADTARYAAGRLDREGYFGPACLDAFSWRGETGVELRPLHDLNCRRSMSDAAYRAWRRIAPDRACYYRFFNRKKLALPQGLSAATEALGERAFDPPRRRGILPVTPLDFGKLAVLFVAEARADVFALETWFRERFET